MANTNLTGPYLLTSDKIDEIVDVISPGTYVLGYVNKNNAFVVEYVGRSDDDLNDRLGDWVDDYESFKFKIYDSAKESFEKECTIYHDFGEKEKLDNDIHPDRPDNSNYSCPVCGL